MFRFAWPWVVILLPVAWIAWRWLPPATGGHGAIRVPYFARLQVNGPVTRESTWHRWLVPVLLWLLLLAAAARPQWLGELDRVPSSGRSLMMAVDVSGSMKTRDMELAGVMSDRLTVIKTLGSDFLERRTGDRVGLILFGSNAYLQAPLTFDRDTVRILLEEAMIGIAGERTAIGDAIGLAIKRIRNLDQDQRVLVLMTDGANTAGNVDPAEAARLAAEVGLRIHTVGIGAERMRVRGLLGMREVNPSADLDEDLLREIAGATGGRYFRAADTADLENIYAELDAVEPVPQADLAAREVREIFYWPLGAAVFLGLLAIATPVAADWLASRRRRRAAAAAPPTSGGP